jgi:hypothetical protein
VDNILWAAVGWAAASTLYHWLSRRALEQERERWMAYIERGTFERIPARTVRPETAEERIDDATRQVQKSWSTKAVQTGVKDLAAAYQAEGLPIPKAEELRREVELMLNAAVQGEAMIDV